MIRIWLSQGVKTPETFRVILVHYDEIRMTQRNILLSRDHARPQPAVATVEASRQLKSELFTHPHYNPVLAPLEYMFGPLKGAMFDEDSPMMKSLTRYVSGFDRN